MKSVDDVLREVKTDSAQHRDPHDTRTEPLAGSQILDYVERAVQTARQAQSVEEFRNIILAITDLLVSLLQSDPPKEQ